MPASRAALTGSIPAVRAYDRGGAHYASALNGVEGVWDDLQVLASKAPQVLSQVVAIARKAQDQLPIIIQIIDKTGKYLPDVLKAIDKIGPYLPKILKILDKAGPKLPKIIATIEEAEDVILAVMEDPALPAVIERIRAIRALEAKKSKGLGQSTSPAAASAVKKPGVGLERLISALDAYLYVRKHPWLPWVAGGGAVLILFGLGFGVGRLTARRRAGSAGRT